MVAPDNDAFLAHQLTLSHSHLFDEQELRLNGYDQICSPARSILRANNTEMLLTLCYDQLHS